jgi:hypothetical protein
MANSYISLYVHMGSITMNRIGVNRPDGTIILSYLPSDESLGYCHVGPSGASHSLSLLLYSLTFASQAQNVT